MVPSLYRRALCISHCALVTYHGVRDPIPVTQLGTDLPEARGYV